MKAVTVNIIFLSKSWILCLSKITLNFLQRIKFTMSKIQFCEKWKAHVIFKIAIKKSFSGKYQNLQLLSIIGICNIVFKYLGVIIFWLIPRNDRRFPRLMCNVSLDFERLPPEPSETKPRWMVGNPRKMHSSSGASIRNLSAHTDTYIRTG